jgi:hypothetical protein
MKNFALLIKSSKNVVGKILPRIRLHEFAVIVKLRRIMESRLEPLANGYL